MDNPALTLWIELLTVAHIAGLARPTPAWDLLADAVNARELECAVADAVTRAIAGRADAITSDLEPQRLAKHLSEVAVAALARREPVCGRREIEWQAGLYRFADVADELRAYVGPRNEPHPATGGWRDRGLDLAGPTIDVQIEGFLSAWPGPPPESLLFGDGSLVAAAARLSTSTERHRQIIEAAEPLTIPGNWHHHIFRPPATDVTT